ncbi:MAG TPA: hypothetical protein VNK03_02830 [Gammaproteobacteria bacterium]|nr:hypothetical protein [Gammaproteobacteria bacterium]
MLVDSAHKAEERRGVSNNIFLGINSLITSFFVFPEEIIHIHIKGVPASLLFALVGMFVSWEWLKVISSYKKINFINYSLINSFEKFFTTYVFSLKGEVEVEHEEENSHKTGSIILKKEHFLPKAFFFLYFSYFVLIVSYFLNSLI